MSARHAGMPTWTTNMDYQHGLPAWTANMDCRHGLPAWTANVDCRHGLPAWTAGMDCRHGLPAWTASTELPPSLCERSHLERESLDDFLQPTPRPGDAKQSDELDALDDAQQLRQLRAD